jgi:putative transposase
MRGRPLKIGWQEDAEQLGQLYRRERDAELRPRLHALWLLRQGYSLRATAALLGVHYVTAQQWVAWYRQGGISEVRGHKRGNSKGSSPRLNSEQLARLHQQASSGAFRTAQEISQWVQKELGVTYTRWGIYSLLRRLRYKAKVPRPLSSHTALAHQQEWKKGG